MNKLQLGILGAFLIICIFLGFLLYGFSYRTNDYVITTDAAFHYEKGKWQEVDLKKVIRKNYILQDMGKIIENQKLEYDQVLKYDGKVVSIPFLGTSGHIKNIDFTMTELTTQDIAKAADILKQKNISKYGTFGVNQKIVLDIDHDGILETIYAVSNVFTSEPRDRDFSLLFMEKEGEIQLLDFRDFKVNDLEKVCALSIYGIIDVNRDSKYEIVTGCAYFDQIGVDYRFYQLKNKQYKEMK